MNDQNSQLHRERKHQGCLICGRSLRYEREGKEQTCTICGKREVSNITCPEGHFVCDECHEIGYMQAVAHLQKSSERDPIKLLEELMVLPGIHLNGPEHHVLVPCVLLVACANAGVHFALEQALPEAIRRARRVPGGTCGYWGVCGAAAGAGIFASVLLETTPLRKETWHIPQLLTAACLERLAETGGPRCCKRTSRLCIEVSVQFIQKHCRIRLPISEPSCSYASRQKECIKKECPYFPKEGKEPQQF